MDESLSKLKGKIQDIDGLKIHESHGPEFQLWRRSTVKLIAQLFDQEALVLFNNQRTITFNSSYDAGDFDRRNYFAELENYKKILLGLLAEVEEHNPQAQDVKIDKDILRKLWQKKQALEENVVKTSDSSSLQEALFKHLENTLKTDSLPDLRYKKLRATRKYENWWSNPDGYPTDNAWAKISPFLEILEQHEAEKTIKNRLGIEGLFVETRSRDEDLHLLVGLKDGSGDKAHMIIDGATGEIRIEHGRQEPTEIVAKIEAILTLPSGRVIKTTREAIELLK